MKIAVICNYVLHPDRIGGMDRFFKLFDESVKKEGHQIIWIFADVIRHSFYKDVTIFSAENNGLLQFTEDYLKKNKAKVDLLITHFVTQYSSHFKRFKKEYTKHSRFVQVDSGMVSSMNTSCYPSTTVHRRKL